jgi:hypothetical protein
MKIVGDCFYIGPELIYSSVAVLVASLLCRREGFFFNLFRMLVTALAAVTLMTLVMTSVVGAGLTDLPSDSASCDTGER